MKEETLNKFIKTAEELSNSTDRNMGAFENKWEWFVLRLEAELHQKDIEKIEEMLEIHNHNSIPSYIDDLDEGCVTCVKNQAISDVLNTLKDRNG